MKTLPEERMTIEALREQIATTQRKIDEEYWRIGHNIPQIIEQEVRSVNQMTDELVRLKRRLRQLERQGESP